MERHPEKTFISPIERGFDFLGYHFNPAGLTGAHETVVRTLGPLDRALRRLCLSAVDRVIVGVFRHHGPEGALARSVQAGGMVFWMIVLLGAYLVLYLV